MVRKWTHENRTLLYKKLLEKFGPYHTWENLSKGIESEFNKYLIELANVFSTIIGKRITPEAVFMQLAWATTSQDSVESTGYTSTYILNMAAAYEAGFLRSRDFPELLLCEREDPNKKKENLK